MPDTTPSELTPRPEPDSLDPTVITGEVLEELADPMAGVVAVELSRRFVRQCLCWAEPMVEDLAGQESMLRKPGGSELAERMLAQRLYQRIDPQVFQLLRVCVPLAQGESALSLMEAMLRARFTDVVKTAVSYLLSDDRDTAIQMTSVATTMAGREVRRSAARIITDTRAQDGGD